MKKENENRGSYDSPKWGKHSKETRKTHCVMVRFDDEEWLKFLSMYDQSGVYARSVFIKARVFSQPFRVIKTDKTLFDYLHQTFVFSCAIPRRGQQLQPSGQGTACTFFREKGDGIAL